MTDRADTETAFDLVARYTNDVVLGGDAQGNITYASPSVSRYGYTPADLIGRPADELTHPDDRARSAANVLAVMRGEPLPHPDRQNRYRAASGEWVWMEGNPTVLHDANGQPTGVLNVLRDVTERRQQHDLFEAAFENAAIGKALVGLDGRFLRVNQAFCQITGYSGPVMMTLDFQTITHPDDLNGDLELLTQLTTGTIDHYRMDKRYIRVDGSVVWVTLTVSIVRGPDGAPKHYVAQVQDLSARRAAEAAQRESEARYRLIAENMSDLVIRMDAQSVVTYVSPSVRTYGYEPEDVIGRRADELIHPEDLARVRANRLKTYGEDPGLSAMADRQVRYRTADGGWVWMEGNPRVVRDDAGRAIGTINVLRNITERRAQADLLEAAFDRAAIGMALTGSNGRVLRVNQALCAMLGVTEAELVGSQASDRVHPDDLPGGEARIARLISGELNSYSVERRYRRGNGEYAWVELTMALVRNPDGSTKYYVSQMRDLSERHAADEALKESEMRFRLIAENTSDIIVMSDLNGKSTYVSPSIRSVGYEPEDLLGGSFKVRTHPDDADVLMQAFRALSKGETTGRVRWRGLHGRTGAWVWLESSPSLLRDPKTGKPTGYLDMVRDVTVQVEQEEALAQARAEAEAAAAAKSQFLANMSHEIRTPLTAVLGFTTLLQESAAVEGVAAGYLERIVGAGAGLLAIVNDILDFSKLEAGKFDIRPRATELSHLCQETLLLFTGQAEAKGLELWFEADPALPPASMVDGDRIRQMLINLIGNALKFTAEGSVSVRVRAEADERVTIEVTDTGPGLDPEAQRILFQRFTQIDGSMTRAHGGTGLGLAICKGIVEAMGGQIGLSSTPGEGATFSLTIPAPAAEPPLAAREGATDLPSIAGVRVLVIDDNATNRELARKVLEAGGAEVTDAADGETGLLQLAGLPVDVVLLDLRMPGLDGRGALKRLRSTPGPNQDIPVLAFTADADVDGGGGMSGFSGLVRKPIAALEMYMAIAQAVSWDDADYMEEDSHAA